MSSICENPLCDHEIITRVSIPLDADCDAQSGSFCCVACARHVNRYYEALDRPRDTWKERDTWIQGVSVKSNKRHV